ncbi:L-aspartate oxidase [Maricaulis salignorans]|uniref:L-aspartate oxidase n=1 Tax=Maricaulis salignorans TaxID=144026 RepID=A0A1G9MR79_9PROT|nr:L-aspartate oxidase [Maricaulis salignorans]SDL76145.1 L-aspartate oxidase [Maricaulis salignorans]
MTRPVLIIGAGIAGLWAALKLAPRKVVLLTGSPLGEGAASGWAQGGVSAALAEDDTPALHARDTIEAGAGLVDAEAAHALAAGAAEQVRELAALGAPFEREGDAWSLSREAAHSRHRVARVTGDGAGAAIMQTLIAAVRAAGHVEIRDGWSAAALIAGEDGDCAGAIARSPTGETLEIQADETILAMGGAGGLFALTTTPAGAQGQAMAMAARLGAEIQDAEFIQFHPTALNAGLDPAPLCTEALRGDGAILIDRSGHRFMKAIHKDAELAPRDVVARAVHRQSLAGKHAMLDCRLAIGAAFPSRFPAVFAACQQAGIDPRIEPIPVAPTAHYHMGGVATDIDGRTSVAGLWAIGECASSGLHGANRLASNSLAEGLVSAARVAQVLLLPPFTGEVARAKPGSMGAAPAGSAPSVRCADTSPVNGGGNLPPALPLLALTRLRQAMSRHCGVERSGAGLTELGGLIEAMIIRHGEADALIAARFIVEGALARTESRGGHFRTDFPQTDAIARHTRLSLADLARPSRPALAHTAPAE